MKPVVGVIPLWDDDKDSLWMLPGYMDGLSEASCVPIMLPLTTDEKVIDQLMSMVDGILFTGGHDVDPSIYGEEPCKELGIISKERDKMESLVLKKAIELDKSMLGICRGIQFINASLGGTLYQDLPTQYNTGAEQIDHHQSAPYDVPTHEVSICKDTPLYNLLKLDRIKVNSYHHQAVKKLSDKLKVMAISEDGLVEAVYMENLRFMWAFQWHPEFSYKVDKNSRLIFEAFAESMK